MFLLLLTKLHFCSSFCLTVSDFITLNNSAHPKVEFVLLGFFVCFFLISLKNINLQNDSKKQLSNSDNDCFIYCEVEQMCAIYIQYRQHQDSNKSYGATQRKTMKVSGLGLPVID